MVKVLTAKETPRSKRKKKQLSKDVRADIAMTQDRKSCLP